MDRDVTDFPRCLSHGDIETIFPDIFIVRGQVQVKRPDRIICTTRTMTILRDDDALTLINAVRMDAEGLKTLDALGRVNAVIRVGGNHGRDDAFYAEHYGVPVWAANGVPFDRPCPQVVELGPQNRPLPHTDVFVFRSTKVPEVIIHLRKQGGILITGDSFQNVEAPDAFVDAPSAAFLDEMGFFKPANIGPIWFKMMAPDIAELRAVLSLDFKHLFPGHGRPLLNTAQEQMAQSVDRLQQPR